MARSGHAPCSPTSMGRRLRLGRAFGIEVAVDWSWILTFILGAWTLYTVLGHLLPHLHPVRLTAASLVATTAIFGSVVLHEVSHGLAARACGVPVRQITLFFLGGITDAERERATPRSEVVAAIVPIAASAALGIVLVLGATIASAPFPREIADLGRLGTPGVITVGVGLANLAIATLGALPAYPLAGGRLLRAGFWKLTGDVERATLWAAWSSQVIGWLLVVFGIALALAGHGTAVAVGMWVALVGWFFTSAAAQAYEGVRIQDVLAGVTVARLLRQHVVRVPVDAPLDTAEQTWLGGASNRSLPVLEDERLVGTISVHDVGTVAPGMRSDRFVRDVMRPAYAVCSGDAVAAVLNRLREPDGRTDPRRRRWGALRRRARARRRHCLD